MNILAKMSPQSHSFKAVKYDAITEDPGETDHLHIVRKSKVKEGLLFFIAGVVTTAILLLCGFVVSHVLMAREKSAQEIEDEAWNHCGRSSKAAMEKRCIMEPLFYGWMPPQCVFQELTAKYPVFEDRKYYEDANKTKEIAVKDLYAGKHITIYTERYHGEHCLFQWRKLQYGMHHRVEFLDNKTISLHHQGHCADQLAVGCEHPGDINVVELGFYRCRKTVW